MQKMTASDLAAIYAERAKQHGWPALDFRSSETVFAFATTASIEQIGRERLVVHRVKKVDALSFEAFEPALEACVQQGPEWINVTVMPRLPSGWLVRILAPPRGFPFEAPILRDLKRVRRSMPSRLASP